MVKENNEDYYMDNGKVVFTKAFHIKRGSCCGNKCTNCPYLPKFEKGATKLASSLNESD